MQCKVGRTSSKEIRLDIPGIGNHIMKGLNAGKYMVFGINK